MEGEGNGEQDSEGKENIKCKYRYASQENYLSPRGNNFYLGGKKTTLTYI